MRWGDVQTEGTASRRSAAAAWVVTERGPLCRTRLLLLRGLGPAWCGVWPVPCVPACVCRGPLIQFLEEPHTKVVLFIFDGKDITVVSSGRVGRPASVAAAAGKVKGHGRAALTGGWDACGTRLRVRRPPSPPTSSRGRPCTSSRPRRSRLTTTTSRKW